MLEAAGDPYSAEAGGRPEDLVQSVGCVMRILEVVGRHLGLPVKTIARRCALNMSTRYDLVRALACGGYVVRLPDGTSRSVTN